jgi:hypothetical protein
MTEATKNAAGLTHGTAAFDEAPDDAPSIQEEAEHLYFVNKVDSSVAKSQERKDRVKYMKEKLSSRGDSERGERLFERRDGTGRGREPLKKGGAGAGNWGSDLDPAVISQSLPPEENLTVDPRFVPTTEVVFEDPLAEEEEEPTQEDTSTPQDDSKVSFSLSNALKTKMSSDFLSQKTLSEFEEQSKHAVKPELFLPPPREVDPSTPPDAIEYRKNKEGLEEADNFQKHTKKHPEKKGHQLNTKHEEFILVQNNDLACKGTVETKSAPPLNARTT